MIQGLDSAAYDPQNTRQTQPVGLRALSQSRTWQQQGPRRNVGGQVHRSRSRRSGKDLAAIRRFLQSAILDFAYPAKAIRVHTRADLFEGFQRLIDQQPPDLMENAEQMPVRIERRRRMLQNTPAMTVTDRPQISHRLVPGELQFRGLLHS